MTFGTEEASTEDHERHEHQQHDAERDAATTYAGHALASMFSQHQQLHRGAPGVARIFRQELCTRTFAFKTPAWRAPRTRQRSTESMIALSSLLFAVGAEGVTHIIRTFARIHLLGKVIREHVRD
jgi:hypothetical protein